MKMKKSDIVVIILSIWVVYIGIFSVVKMHAIAEQTKIRLNQILVK